MKLKSLRLENIACFEDITLDFCHDETGAPCNWVVLLGENGTGKSTLLRMLATGLSSSLAENTFEAIPLRFDLRPLVRDKERLDTVQKKSPITPNSEPGDITSEIKYIQNSYHSCIIAQHGPKSVGYSIDDKEGANIKFLYGFSKTIPPNRFIINSEYRSSVKRFGRLFGLNDFVSVNHWLSNSYSRYTHPKSTQKDKDIFNKSIQVLEKCLPNIKFKEVSIDGIMRVTDGTRVVGIDDLSDGYRSISDWVFDLIRWLFEAFPDSPDPLAEEGVALIDEIDLHLHPRWQRDVIENIRSIFPNIQFIVTTHSPFVAQDMTKDDKLIVLKRGEDGAVHAEHGMGFAQRWRVDQILTSWLFDLPTTRGEQAGSDEAEYQSLLENKISGKLTNAQKIQLGELKRRLDQDPLGETLEDREIYAAADALATALLKDDQD